MTPAKRDELERLLGVVDGHLAALPRFTWETRNDHRLALQKLCQELERTEGARFADRGEHVTIELGGMSSSSVMGAQYALRNWTATVRKHIGSGGGS
jgi:hypothetical protein